jgi:hypothetical protein
MLGAVKHINTNKTLSVYLLNSIAHLSRRDELKSQKRRLRFLLVLWPWDKDSPGWTLRTISKSCKALQEVMNTHQ